MNIVEDAKALISVLKQKGFEAYIVGGYVRDYLLKKKTNDIDIATNALPDDIVALFPKTILTGLKHGTVTVLYNETSFEITTFRIESTYVNNRKPEEVYFVRTLKEDVMRRDFTMNALALTENDEVLDYVNGISDINQKRIKTVGDPNSRFNEDALRMLRAFRFASLLGFSLDEDVLQAIKEYAHLISNISQERIIIEFEKLIKGEHIHYALQKMMETHFHHYLPYFKDGIEAIVSTRFIPFDFLEFLSICSVTGGIEEISLLPIPNTIKREVRIVYEMFSLEITTITRPLLFRNGLRNCLIVNQLNVYLRNLPNKKEEIINEYKKMPIHKQCDLKFGGDEIIQLYDKKPGGWVSEILDELILMVLSEQLENDYQKIRQYLLKKG